MKRIRRGIVLALILAVVAACGGGAPQPGAPGNPPPLTAPTLLVAGPPVTEAQFEAIAKVLELPPKAYQAGGGYVQHTDLAAFLSVPTQPVDEIEREDEEQAPLEAVAFDFDAIAKMPVLDEAEALGRVVEAAEAGGWSKYDLGQPLVSSYQIQHARLEARDALGNEIVDVPIDTQVAIELEMEGVPVIGPGAKLRVVFDAEGNVTQMTHTVRPVEKGPDVPIRFIREAAEEALERYQLLLDQGGSDIQVEARLVYYAPGPEITTVKTLYPHYEVDGSYLPQGADERAQLRTLLLPAVQNGAQPQATLVASLNGKDVEAMVTIQSGTPPFDIEWSSSTNVFGDAVQGKSGIAYPLGTSPLPDSTEIVGVTVTDANGLTVTGSVLVAEVPVFVPPPVLDEGTLEHGSEWVGESQGLPRSGRNASRFVSGLSSVSIPRFNWGDYQTAERRFKDVSFGGADHPSGVDSVDIAFFTGHANGNGWNFPTAFDRGDLVYPNARYGEGDLEWLIIAACGPLQQMSNEETLYERWGPAFQGLHLLCGYANVSKDNALEGLRLAELLVGGWTVRQAWIQTAIDIQGRDQIAGVMGVLGPGWITNWNDHLHGRGSVGPDITDVRGYWHIYMNCR